MGISASTNKQLQLSSILEMEIRSRAIDDMIELERKKKQITLKILLLGAGESGKTTVLKQIRLCHTEGFSEEEYIFQSSVIRRNVITAMTSILGAMREFEIRFQSPQGETDEMMFLSSVEKEWLEQKEFNLLPFMQRLWADPGLQKCYMRRNEYNLMDSAKYFLDNMERILVPCFRPNVQDILCSRSATTSVTELQFTYKKLFLRMVDVGGQRSQRRKWLQCFSDVNSIIFIAAISEYDQNMQEDQRTNRMLETLKLYDSICNHRLIQKIPIVLFLNKYDIFAEKIQYSSLKQAFPDYEGPQTEANGRQFIRKQFVTISDNANRSVYPHETCATDTKQIQFALDSTLDGIVAKNIKNVGFG